MKTYCTWPPSSETIQGLYDPKLCQLLDECSQILIVIADNVGSHWLQNIRRGLHGDLVVLMNKSIMLKCSIRLHAVKTNNQAFLNLVPLLIGNMRLVFTRGDLKEMSEEVAKYQVRVPTCVGLVAPIDVIVPPE